MAPLSSKISEFLSNVGQGIKPNMFEVEIAFPQSGVGAETLSAVSQDEKNITNLLCKSAALPASSTGVIEVPFRGRTVKIAGDRTFDTWSPTFINDKDFKIRALFEQWSEAINGHAGNTADLITPDNSAGYTADILVHQLEKNTEPTNSNILRTYKLWYAFPTNVSQIDLAYDSNDQIEEFSVEFQYSYWTTEPVANRRGGLTSREINADV
jgi:hypothetical protein